MMYMRNALLLLTFMVVLIQCQNTPKSAGTPPATTESAAKNGPTEQIRGLLVIASGRTNVLDQVNNEVYEIADRTGKLDSAYVSATMPCPYVSKYVFSVLTGRFNGLGKMGLRLFEVSQIDTITAKNPENVASLGIPFEFWCHGNEPFWSIQVSNYEGGIFYENLADGTGWFCPWFPAVVGKDTWTYDIPASEGMNGAMQFTIKKEKCDDGMSEQIYDYSVVLKVNGAKYHGVAIKGTGKAMGPLSHKKKDH